jgi:hypothetical protein
MYAQSNSNDLSYLSETQIKQVKSRITVDQNSISLSEYLQNPDESNGPNENISERLEVKMMKKVSIDFSDENYEWMGHVPAVETSRDQTIGLDTIRGMIE